MIVRWLTTLTVLAQVLGIREQKFAMEPPDQVVVVGNRVTLPCHVINKSGLVQWTKDGFALGELKGFDRYSYASHNQEGDYTLEIYPTKLEDDALYQCQVGAGDNGELPALSRVANLSVLVPPEPPKIIQGSQLTTTEGSHLELECVSVSGRPPAKITWVDGEGNILQDVIVYISEAKSDQKTYDSRSILKLTAKKEYHNITLSCQAQNLADRSYRTAQLKLQVKFAPMLKVITIGNNTRLLEGEHLQLMCLALANPPKVAYRWFINDQLVLGKYSAELDLRNVSQRHHNSVIKCEAYNEIGKNEEIITLDVSYGPRFRVKPYSIQADIGASVTLSCEVDGNPQPTIVWIHEDSARVVSTSSNLTLTVSHDTAGRYFCRATVPGFRDIKADATVYMKGPPTIISHRIQYGIPGDSVRLECSAFSIPTPQKVVWSFHGEDVGSDLDYDVIEEQLTEGIKSTLIIHESHLEHFGVYNCTVSNPYGSDEVEITLRAQKSFPIHTTLIAIMVGIVVIVTAATVFMLCQRDISHKGDNKNVKPRESDRSSNISDLKLEIEYSSEGSESGSESALRGTGLPLAGPVPLDHTYSLIHQPGLHLTNNEGQSNNGYVPITDYSRDYGPLPDGVSPVPAADAETVDPRYSAVYGNPYLRLSTSPQTGLPSPPYNRMRNHIAKPPIISTLATHV